MHAQLLLHINRSLFEFYTFKLNFKDAHVPELLVNNQKLAGVKKSSSSSEEGFVKIYSDLGKL